MNFIDGSITAAKIVDGENKTISINTGGIMLFDKLIQKELTQEEHLKRVDEFIKDHNVEHDGEYVYLYKAVNLDGTNIYDSKTKIKYEIGRIYIGECNNNIYKECGEGLHASTYKNAINFGRVHLQKVMGLEGLDREGNVIFKSPVLEPQNPQVLYEKPKFRLFKIRTSKKNIIVPINSNGKVRCSQIEVIGEIEPEKIEYETVELYEHRDGSYLYKFRVGNVFTGKSVDVVIITNELFEDQNNIKSTIKEELEKMQKIYDVYRVSKGILD